MSRCRPCSLHLLRAFAPSRSILPSRVLAAAFAMFALSSIRLFALDSPVHLLNGRDLSPFYTFLEKFGAEKDPDKVFSVQDGLLRISGQHYGYIATRDEFSDYRLVVEFKWGEKTWPPREKNARDSGVLVHGVGPDKVWMKSIESQLIEGGTGDIIVIGGACLTVGGKSTCDQIRFDRPGRNPWKDELGFIGPNEIENPHGEWNTMEVVCRADTIKISINGKVTLEGERAEPRRGKILIQSEGAEVFFRKIDLLPLEAGR